ncbi:MAG: amidohydrolase family protein [Chloroflexi bacterium]|nr:amidohydrolase family protein [Chloroflexota bacterium]
MFDILIKNGTIIDGSGMPGYRGDVAIKDGRIVARGRIAGESASETIDADGLVVAPGFIDVHTHYDPHLFWDPLVTPSCWHGVTTVVMGNCGLSLAPLKPEHREAMLGVFGRVEELSQSSLRHMIPWTWQTYGEFLDKADHGLGMNVAGLVGHNALRLWVMGEAARERAATGDELCARASPPAQSAGRRQSRHPTSASTVSRSPAASPPTTNSPPSLASSANSTNATPRSSLATFSGA